MSRHRAFRLQPVIRNWAEFPGDQKVYVSIYQFTSQRLLVRGGNIKYYARIASRELIDNSRNKGRGEKLTASDPYATGRRIGEKLDVLTA